MKNLITTLNSKFSHSSLAIRYLQKFVETKEYKPKLEEYTINQHVDDIVRSLYEGKYNVIAFSCYIWNYEMILKITQDLKIASPNLIIILGGPEVSYKSEDIMKEYDFIDYIITGEGELIYEELCDFLFLNKGSINNIYGLTYRDINNDVLKNENRKLIKNLDIVLFPYDDISDLENRKIYYESSRGCPYSCQYCLSSMTGRVRFFSVDRVKSDLRFFLDKKVEQVKFVDRTFNADPNRALEIFKFLHENDNGFTNFHFEIVASLLNEETLNYLSNVRCGLFQFEIGVQTTNSDSMVAIKRNIEFSKIENSVESLSKYKNIHLHLDLIAGLPYEGYESFLDSFEDVYSLKPEKLQLGFLKLLKGSGLRLNSEKYGYAFSKQAPYEIFHSNSISFDELIKLKYLEEILETYYNSNRFVNSLNIITSYYKRSVDFYIDFSMYWKSEKLFDRPHKLSKLYEILMKFYEYKKFANINFFKEIVKHDYFLNNQKSPFGAFDIEVNKEFTNLCYAFVRDSKDLRTMILIEKNESPKILLKRLKFIKYKYDILSNNNLETMDKIFMYDYKLNNSFMYISKAIDITDVFLIKE